MRQERGAGEYYGMKAVCMLEDMLMFSFVNARELCLGLGDSLIPCRHSSIERGSREYHANDNVKYIGENMRGTYAVLEACVVQVIYNGVRLGLEGGSVK